MRRLLFVILNVVFVAGVFGQQTIVDQFEKRSHTLDGFTLPYRLFVPANYDAGMKYPIVLALHGAGERGTDNERHIVPHRLATSWADPENQAENPAFVVAPQVPPGGRWTADLPVDESDFNQEELTTLAILDSLAREFNIDPERVYVTGLSMGGHGTWDLISRLPDRFAAAIPMSGNADPTQASRLLHVPIWTFHGESDTVVRPFGARGIVQNMEDAGRDVIYTDCRRAPVQQINFDCAGVIPGSELASAIDAHADLIYTAAERVGHGPWNVWYDHPLLAGWLFSKQRVVTDAIQIDQPVAGARWSGESTVSWSSEGPESDTVEV
ncbi:MAG: dienelactone hydrolase family protein, partial [Rhodothermia bacterium]|nr:dienelactone hydrolase family protein [Rhodothermia bacterium]